MLFMLIAFFFSAAFAGKTYCVGGADPSNPHAESNHACYAWRIRSKHGQWHFHTFVRDPHGNCYACWDEVDDTCESVFLYENPNWSYGVEFFCRFNNPSEIHSHVINGRVVQETPPPPPPPKPEKVRVDIRIPPGPYKKEGSVLVEGVLLGEDGGFAEKNGDRLRVRSGYFLIQAEGIETKIPARASVTGAMEARIPIPDAPEASISFVVDSIADPKSFTVVKKKDTEKIKITQCEGKPRFVKPLPNAIAAQDIPFFLEASVDSSQFQNPDITFEIEVQKPSLLDDPSKAKSTIKAKENKATWIPPVIKDDSETVFVKAHLKGKEGSIRLCPPPPVTFEISNVQIAIETTVSHESLLTDISETFSGTPDCVVGVECDISFTLNESQKSTDPMLDDKDTKIELLDAKKNVLHTQTVSDSTTINTKWMPTVEGKQIAFIRVTKPDGTTLLLEGSPFYARGEVDIQLPPKSDFQSLTQGQNDTCLEIDVAKSRLKEDDVLRFSVTGVPKKCGVNIDIGFTERRKRSSFRGYITDEQPFDIFVTDENIIYCATLDGCGSLSSQDLSETPKLTVQPLNPGIQSFSKTTELNWFSVEEPWYVWSCYGWLLALGGITGLTSFLIGGWTLPAHFSDDITFEVSTGRNRWEMFYLSDSSASKRKFWRPSRVYFHEGEPSQKTGSFYIQAEKNGLVTIHGDLQYKEKKVWKDLENNILELGLEYRSEGIRYKFNT